MADRNYINDSLSYLADKINFYTYKKVPFTSNQFASGMGQIDGENNNGQCYYEKIGNFVHIHLAVSGFPKNLSTTKLILPAKSIPAEIKPPHTIQAIMNGGSRDAKAVVWITGPNHTASGQVKGAIYGCSENSAAIGDFYYFYDQAAWQ